MINKLPSSYSVLDNSSASREFLKKFSSKSKIMETFWISSNVGFTRLNQEPDSASFKVNFLRVLSSWVFKISITLKLPS